MSQSKFFVDYYAEERGETVILSDRGWISYKLYDKEIMICDFFVAKEFRGTRAAKNLADLVQDEGRKRKCTHVSCYIQQKNSTEAERKRTTMKLKLYLHYGFVLALANDVQILLIKDL